MKSEKLKKLFNKEAWFSNDPVKIPTRTPPDFGDEEEELDEEFQNDQSNLNFMPTEAISSRDRGFNKVAIKPSEAVDIYNKNNESKITSQQLRDLAIKTNIRRYFPDVQRNLESYADQMDAGQNHPDIRGWLEAIATTLENFDLSEFSQSVQDAGPAAANDIWTLLAT